MGWEGVWQTTHIPEIPLISEFIYTQNVMYTSTSLCYDDTAAEDVYGCGSNLIRLNWQSKDIIPWPLNGNNIVYKNDFAPFLLTHHTMRTENVSEWILGL